MDEIVFWAAIIESQVQEIEADEGDQEADSECLTKYINVPKVRNHFLSGYAGRQKKVLQ